ncbi:hypothetical protein L2E82_30216 [Cichorium intybus]|uniref:Uncharacterized protein n=1 Tax=Cichorium intybus TaxID=13427 RepID=A0ACB9CZR5_CICIN|nr:hypothetical protein L2E82_30216 [Cichorium intybus]
MNMHEQKSGYGTNTKAKKDVSNPNAMKTQLEYKNNRVHGQELSPPKPKPPSLETHAYEISHTKSPNRDQDQTKLTPKYLPPRPLPSSKRKREKKENTRERSASPGRKPTTQLENTEFYPRKRN